MLKSLKFHLLSKILPDYLLSLSHQFLGNLNHNGFRVSPLWHSLCYHIPNMFDISFNILRVDFIKVKVGYKSFCNVYHTFMSQKTFYKCYWKCKMVLRPTLNVHEIDPDYLLSKQIDGQAAEVIGEHCNQEGIKELMFSQPSGPVFHYDPPNSKSFGDQPLLGLS